MDTEIISKFKLSELIENVKAHNGCKKCRVIYGKDKVYVVPIMENKNEH